jgi:predicted amidohydrolase YtcJ
VPGQVVIYVARRFLTMDESTPEATAVAVRDGRVVAVGSLDSVQEALGDPAARVDRTLEGHVVIAGLIDQHLHPFLGATTLTTTVIAPEPWDLPARRFEAATTPEAYRDRLAAEDAALSDPDEMLMTWGYHPLWHGGLDRAALDGINSSRPIVVWQRSCHEFWLNGAAIRSLGLSRGEMEGQERAAEMMDWDAGHWWETGINLVAQQIVLAYFTPERMRHGLRQLVAYLHARGVTAINEPGVLPNEPWELYDEILGDPSVPLLSTFLVDARTQADSGMDTADALGDARAQVARAPAGKVRMVDRSVKLFADGAIISQRMQMNEPYVDAAGRPDPGHGGEWMMEPETFARFFRVYWEAGWQLNVHVNGDAGLELVLDTLESCQRAHPRDDHRTVLAHFACSKREQVERIARLGAIVAANPYYPVGFADKFGEVGLGPARADNMVRAATVLELGIPLSYHSDLPMAPADPLGLAWCGVNRITSSGRVAGPSQRISVHDALRAVTIEAAYSWRMEHELGSIALGKLANFTVLEDDPYEVDPGDLDKIRVAGVVYEGTWHPVERSAPASGEPAGASRSDLLRLAVPPDPGGSSWSHHGAGCACAARRTVMEAFDAAWGLGRAA